MASIILPRRWQQQPSGQFELDWRNELTRGLAHCYVGGDGYHVNRVTGQHTGTLTGRMGSEARPDAQATAGTGSAYMLDSLNAPTALPLSIGVIAGARPNGNGPIFGSFTGGSVGSAVAAVGTGFIGNAYPEYRIDLDSGVIVTDTDAHSSLVNTDRAYVCRSNSTTDHALIVGRRKTTNTTTRNVVVASAQVGLGRAVQHNFSAGTLAETAWFSLACMWFRGLDDAEAFEFNAAPWQIFRPRRSVLYFDAGGGGVASLLVQDATHGHMADAPGLSAQLALSVAHSAHAHMADGVALSTAHVLAVADALHGHAADVLALATQSALAVADAGHAHLADALSLSASGAATLAIAESSHAHSADAIALTTASLLAVADALHAHTADSASLGAALYLAISASLHGHAVDAIGLTDQPTLGVADTAHSHASDTPALSSHALLAVADAVHAHLADGTGLGYAATLAILESMHAHASDVLAMSSGGSSTLGLPDEIRIVIAEQFIKIVRAERHIFRS